MRSHSSIITCLLMLAALAGCDSKGITRPPQALLRVVHAAPNFNSVHFMRVQREEGSLSYSQAATFTFDSDTYTFALDTEIPGETVRERQSVYTSTIDPTVENIVVMTSPGRTLTPLQFTAPLFDTSSSQARAMIVNAVPGLTGVDFYVEAPGTDLTTVSPRGSADYSAAVAPTELAAGNYRLSVTPAGTPGTLLYESSTFALNNGSSVLLVFADSGGQVLTDYDLFLVGQASTFVPPNGQQVAMRVINAVSDQLPRDIYVDMQFTTPVIAGLAYGEVSPYVTIPPASTSLNMTPAGNPGAVERNHAISISTGGTYTTLFAGDASTAFVSQTVLDDRRPIADIAQIRFLHGAGLFGVIDFYLTDPGVDVTTVVPTIALFPAGMSNMLPILPGDYELTVVDDATATTIAGPVPITLEAGGFYGTMALDGASGAAVDLALIDDFN